MLPAALSACKPAAAFVFNFLLYEWALEKTRAVRPWLQVVPGVRGLECITSFAPEKRMGSTLNLLHNIIEAACITKSNITFKIL
jgi:hypothetical protein